MRKFVFLFLGLVVIAISGYLLFSKAFVNIESVYVQPFDKEKKEFVDGKILNDPTSIEKLTDILNGATHRKGTVDMAHPADYKLTITYEDKKDSELLVWAEFGDSILLLGADADIFRINKNSHQEAFLSIVK
jgi:hypothetical protein